MEPGEYLQVVTNNANFADTDYVIFSLVATPQVSDAIILESQDEIFTDWVEYSPVTEGMGTLDATSNVQWRRVGSNMEIMGYIRFGTVSSTAAARLGLPTGYSLNPNIGGGDQKQIYGYYFLNNGGSNFYSGNDKQIGILGYDIPNGSVNNLCISGQSGDDHSFYDNVATTFFGNDQSIMFNVSVPIQGWNTNFNPLLSMPLVKLGTDVAEYAGSWAAASAGYRKYVNAVTSDTVTNSGLGTITPGSSTTSFYFQASVDCIVSFNYSYGQGAGVDYYQNILRGTAAAVIDTTVGSNDASLAGMRMANTQYWAIYANIDMIDATFPVKAGEMVAAGQSATSTDYGGIMNSQFQMTVQRDRGNTNMAHIIKPAVAIIKDVKAYNAGGGNSSATSFNDRDLNTLEGESWFVTLASNQVTLEPGTYKIDGTVPGFRTGAMHGRLYDVTNSKELMIGTSEVSDVSSGQGSIISRFGGTITLTASTTFKVQSYSQSASTSTYGLGYYSSPSTDSSIYTQVFIEKLK